MILHQCDSYQHAESKPQMNEVQVDQLTLLPTQI